MSLTKILNRVGKFVADNSPAIFTAIGVTGALTTAYLTGKASFKASQVICDEQRRQDSQGESHLLETKEKVELVWKLYIPAIGTGVLTVASIICANQIGTRRAAAMATAYSLSEKAWEEYKDKVIEKIGGAKERKIRDQLEQDRIDKNPINNREVIITGGADVLCYDSFTGRYFKSDMESLKKAQNDLNHMILNNYYASLTDFYDYIGLPKTTYSDEVGWNSDKLLEIEFSATMSENDRPCISIKFDVSPIRGYHRVQ